jgi:hypothetical protein
MWYSVYEVSKASCMDPKKLMSFATDNSERYGVTLHKCGELVVDAFQMADLKSDFSAQFPEHCDKPPEGQDDPACEWHPLDFYKTSWHGNRIWSEGNPKWRPVPKPPRPRLP